MLTGKGVLSAAFLSPIRCFNGAPSLLTGKGARWIWV